MGILASEDGREGGLLGERLRSLQAEKIGHCIGEGGGVFGSQHDFCGWGVRLCN